LVECIRGDPIWARCIDIIVNEQIDRIVIIWHYLDEGVGENLAGKILMCVRNQIRPENLLIGDSLTRGIRLPETANFCWPGATVEKIAFFAKLLGNIPTKILIVIVGTNDLVSRDKSVENPHKVLGI